MREPIVVRHLRIYNAIGIHWQVRRFPTVACNNKAGRFEQTDSFNFDRDRFITWSGACQATNLADRYRWAADRKIDGFMTVLGSRPG